MYFSVWVMQRNGWVVKWWEIVRNCELALTLPLILSLMLELISRLSTFLGFSWLFTDFSWRSCSFSVFPPLPPPTLPQNIKYGLTAITGAKILKKDARPRRSSLAMKCQRWRNTMTQNFANLILIIILKKSFTRNWWVELNSLASKA